MTFKKKEKLDDDSTVAFSSNDGLNKPGASSASVAEIDELKERMIKLENQIKHIKYLLRTGG